MSNHTPGPWFLCQDGTIGNDWLRTAPPVCLDTFADEIDDVFSPEEAAQILHENKVQREFKRYFKHSKRNHGHTIEDFRRALRQVAEHGREDTRPKSENEANAKIMVASLEMLETLKKCRDALERFGCTEELASVDAVIKKATE